MTLATLKSLSTSAFHINRSGVLDSSVEITLLLLFAGCDIVKIYATYNELYYIENFRYGKEKSSSRRLAISRFDCRMIFHSIQPLLAHFCNSSPNNLVHMSAYKNNVFALSYQIWTSTINPSIILIHAIALILYHNLWT